MPFVQPIGVSDSEYQAQEELLFRTAARLRGLLFYRVFVLAALPVVAWLYRDAIASPPWFWTAFGLLIGTQLIRIGSDYIGGNLAKNASFNIFVDAVGYTLLAASSEGLDSPFIYFFILLSLYSVVWFDRRVSMAVGGVIAVCLTTLYAVHGLPMVGSAATFASMLLVLVGLALGTGEIARLVAEARERMVRAAMELIVANKRILAQQQALRASEERVRLVLDTAEEGIFGMDLDGTCIFANRSCLNMLGYKSEEVLLGKDMHLLIHHTRPNGNVYHKEDCLILKAGRQGERAHSTEEMHWRADGTGFPVEYWSHPIISDGKPVGIVVTFLDITERKRAETSLRRAQFMVENTPQEVWLADVQGHLVYVNKAAAASLGYEQAELAHMTVADVDPVGGPAFEAQAALLKAGHQASFETVHRARDGREIPKEIRASHICLDGRDYICGFAQDISERKRAQARLEELSAQNKAIIDNADYSIITTDLDGLIVRFNAAAERMLGYSAQEMEGRQTPQIIHDEEEVVAAAEALSRELGQVVAPGFEVFVAKARQGLISEQEWSYIRKDGSRFPVLLSVGGLRDSSGKLTGFLGIASDISARKEAEAALHRLNQELEERVAQRTQELADSYAQLKEAFATIERAQDELVRSEKLASLGSLVAGVAHELNTPLGNSLTVATTLAERAHAIQKEVGAGALRRSTLNEFIQSTSHASDLLTRNLFRASELITHFKQVAVDQTSAQRRPFDLAEMVAEVVLTLQPQFKKTPHQIELAIPDGIQMDSYPGPLGQVITNLVSNALVHGFEVSRPGLVRISASASADEVCLTVADDGRGISQEHQAKVFDPFFTTRLGQGGSGLGLHIVYSIVTRVLGGRIALASQPGEGTTLTLHLPLHAPAQDRQAATAGMAIPSS